MRSRCIIFFTSALRSFIKSTYCVSSPEQWNCITCDSTIKLDYVVEENGVRALQGYDSTTQSLFVAFRGSASIQNWIDNIKVSQITPYEDESIGVEKGFYKSYNYLKVDLFDNLSILSKKYGTRNILITGHSLGAAMATSGFYMARDELQSKFSYRTNRKNRLFREWSYTLHAILNSRT